MNNDPRAARVEWALAVGARGRSSPYRALAVVLEQGRPWRDDGCTAVALRTWASASDANPPSAGWPGGWEFDLAEHLRRIGTTDPDIAGDVIAPIAWGLLGGLVLGGEAIDKRSRAATLARMQGRGRLRARDRGGRQPDAWERTWLGAVRFQQDIAALVQGGRSPAAAKRWVKRHPGADARDARPPRSG